MVSESSYEILGDVWTQSWSQNWLPDYRVGPYVWQMKTKVKYYTLIDKISLSCREDKPRIQFPLFVREVCCFPHPLMRERERSKSHPADAISQSVFSNYKYSLTICQHLHKYLCALKRPPFSLNSQKRLSASCSLVLPPKSPLLWWACSNYQLREKVRTANYLSGGRETGRKNLELNCYLES